MLQPRLLKSRLLPVSKQEYITLTLGLALSIVLLFSGTSQQVEYLRSELVDVWAHMLKPVKWFRSMSDLRHELALERQRNARLLLENSRLREAALENYRLRALLKFRDASPFELVSARVIARHRDGIAQSFTLDIGRKQGARKNMPLIMPAGLVGRILRVGENSSTAQLVLDHNFHAACKIQRSRVDGILAYENGNMCVLAQVPKNADVQPGDVVITSGYSSLFPPGLPVGIVVQVDDRSPTLFKRIKVKPFVDFSTVEEVFAIKSFANHAPN